MNRLDKFRKRVVGSSFTHSDYVPVIDPSGDMKRITDMDVILNSWETIIRTPKGTDMSDPNFGTNIYKYIFEMSDAATYSVIKSDIITALTTYDDRAVIDSVKVSVSNDYKHLTLNIVARSTGEIKSRTLNLSQDAYLNFILP